MIVFDDGIQGITIFPQWDSYRTVGARAAGTITLPTEPNGGLWGLPLIARPPVPSSEDTIPSTVPALLIPSVGIDSDADLPTTPVYDGMLLYAIRSDTGVGALRLYADGAWQTVALS